ncbi:ABC transporter substrate-binding protein [Saccharopolyspora mangrovi]|uniref:ABC transporter substrate-binding protein n=1 Tax=Saccharopolyspora mangrovi TaxID=3082379 RepID=A0ABU6AG01_9PSEU|nr:ABC transporter substrate-binding protein [Saccharopolyspora sp. S2-29]MEB3370398.1 ABC transporter substrate-binding protein [Saccharopolyspora sp. S2-29]
MPDTSRTEVSPAPRRLGVLALSLLMLVTACSGGEAEGGKVALRVLWWGSDSRHQQTQRMIEEFEEEHPNIDVEPEFTGWNDYWDRLATGAAANDLPDVIQHDADYLREYADRGALLELDEHIPHTLDTSKLDPSVLGTGKVEGKTVAIPSGINTYGIAADPVIFEQAGVPMPDDKTWTWQQFIDTAAQITAKTPDDVHGLQDIGFVDAGLVIFARQRGEEFYAPGGGLGVSDRTLADWFRMMQQARDSQAEPEPSRSVEVQAGNVDQSLIATNKGAMGAWWTNQLPAITELSGRELRFLRFPGEQPKPGMYLKPAMLWTASSNTDHPEEAATFINWLVNSPKAAEIQLSDRGLPINTDIRHQIVDKLKPADRQAAQFLDEVTPALAPPPQIPPPGSPEVQDVLMQVNEAVLFNRISIEQAVQQFRQQATAAIE